MNSGLFVDTSAWFAFANRKDPDHAAVRDILRRYDDRLVTSNFVFDETVTLARYRLGHHVAEKIGESLLDANVARLIRATSEDEHRAWELFCKRPDQSYSYTDCLSFEMMKRLKVTTAATLDDDFVHEGFEVLP